MLTQWNRRFSVSVAMCSLGIAGCLGSRQRYERVITRGAGHPEWIELGPASISPWDDYNLAGAVGAVLPDPERPERIFVGSVNGGVWRTENAIDPIPTWETSSDRPTSLSVSDLQFDPMDGTRATVFAGVADFSAFGPLLGGPLTGVMRSPDSGGSWELLGNGDLAGAAVRNVCPTTTMDPGQVVLVATDRGVFRSTDGGGHFGHLGLSAGVPGGDADASSMVVHPSDSSELFVAFPGHGIFRTNDAGTQWQEVTNNVPRAGDGGIDSANRIKLSVSQTATHPIYAAISAVDAATNSVRLAGLYRSTDHGAMWTALSVPNPQLNVTYADFAFAADPQDPDVVFAAGYSDLNRLHMGTVGADGQVSWTVCWETGTAHGTKHHGDARSIAFDASGNLLIGDDGGVYRLARPREPLYRDWKGINGTLAITEINSVAYDTLNRIAFAGHQDNGSAQQRGEEDPLWQITGDGDGTAQAADNSADDQTIRFSCTGGQLPSLMRATYDSNNHVIETPRHVMLASSATPDVADSGLLSNRAFGGFALNNVTPSRILLFGGWLYESTVKSDGSSDHGDTVRTVSLPDDVVDVVDNTKEAAVYGGWSGGQPEPGVIYVGFRVKERGIDGAIRTVERLFFRDKDGDSVARLPFPGATIRGIATDPADWHIVYVVASSKVYRSGDAGQHWSDISAGLSLSEVRTVAVANREMTPDNETVYVGGDFGVFFWERGGSRSWKRLGTNLPTVIVNDLRYYASAYRSGRIVGDVLLAGTAGRGAWLWEWNAWRTNLSLGMKFVPRTWRGDWGSDGPILVGDFNGDRRTDVMMWRDATKTWSVNLSTGSGFDNYTWTGAWGSDGPIFTGDLNGDGKTDVYMWRDATKTWSVNLSTGSGFDNYTWTGAWGSDGPIFTGDLNGDGKTDVLMWRNSDKTWSVNLSTGSGFDNYTWTGAWGSDGPIATGDLNGDGKTDVLMWRNSYKTWSVNLSTGSGFDNYSWTGAWGSDGPIMTGDFNGDSKTDVLIWHP